MLLNLGLVESVDDCVFSLAHENPLDLAEESGKEFTCQAMQEQLTFLSLWKETWPTAMLPSFLRFDHGV
jgi:hypothetical protein